MRPRVPPTQPMCRVGHIRRPSRFSEAGFESMKLGAFLLFGRTKGPDLHRNSPAFFAAFPAPEALGVSQALSFFDCLA
jgi:hypothetical protein